MLPNSRFHLATFTAELAHEQGFFAAHPVRSAAQIENLAAMQQPIQNRHHQSRVADDQVASLAQALIGDDDGRPPLVAGRHQFVERRPNLRIDRQIAKLIEYT